MKNTGIENKYLHLNNSEIQHIEPCAKMRYLAFSKYETT